MTETNDIQEESRVLLPENFQFSAKSLDDYLRCQRKFQLTYLQNIHWPALPVDPVDEFERHIRQGQEFHRLIQRAELGIPENLLVPSDPQILRWWKAYQQHRPVEIPQNMLVEVQVSTPINEHRLTARFDLLGYTPGQEALIIDWKTSKNIPDRSHLKKRMQTRLYPLMLHETALHLLKTHIPAEGIQLVYWFAEAPKYPIRFQFDDQQLTADREYITEIIEEITSRDPEGAWPLVNDERICKFCQYRSLCDRGISAGSFIESEDSSLEDITIDLEFLDEISF